MATMQEGDISPEQESPIRHDGWTATRREKFLEVVARTCNISQAAKASSMHISSAYRLRARDAAFRDAWEEALDEAYTALEMAVMAECLAGSVVTTVVREGGAKHGPIKETRTVHSRNLAVALQLLRQHKATVMERRAQMAGTHADGLTRDIMARVRQARGDAEMRSLPEERLEERRVGAADG